MHPSVSWGASLEASRTMDRPEFDRRIADRARRALEAACSVATRADKARGGYSIRNRLEEIQLHCCGYAEPGYSSDTGLVATGNWNDIDSSDLPSRLCNIFEKLGIEIEWSDEWSTCDTCGKLVRTFGDSYHWQPSYVMGDGEINCHECIADDADTHLANLEGNPDTCNTIASIDPADHGYKLVNKDSYETGWHPGQNDDPKKIAADLKAHGIERFLFQLDENSQFYSRWSVYVHESEAHLLTDTSEQSAETDV